MTMKITLDITKTVEENAQDYYEKAKRAKKKLQGLLEKKKEILLTIEHESIEHDKVVQQADQPAPPKRKTQWYEKFRWCILSNGMLAIGGKDATTNEIIVKKHTLAHDMLFHTDMAGSPFICIQTNQQPVPPQIAHEGAQLCAIYSRAWGRKYGTIEVFSAKPEQVTKEAQSGEYLPKGAFMVRGQVTHYTPRMELAIGTVDGAVMAGPISAIKKHCTRYIVIVQGDEKTSDIAKKIERWLKTGDLDAIVRSLPTGGCQIDRKRSIISTELQQ